MFTFELGGEDRFPFWLYLESQVPYFPDGRKNTTNQGIILRLTMIIDGRKNTWKKTPLLPLPLVVLYTLSRLSLLGFKNVAH